MDLGSCGMLETQEMGQLCIFLSEKINGLRLLPLLTAGLSAITTFLIAWFTWGATRRASRESRANAAQREALIAIQNTALKLRNSWLAYHKYVLEGYQGGNPFDDMSQAKLAGKFETARVRVDDDHLRVEYQTWAKYAEELFSGSPVKQESEESVLWDFTVNCSGKAIRRLDKD